MKPNFYDCKYRRDIPGDAHSSCNHPLLNGKDNNPFGAMVEMLSGKFNKAAHELNIKGNPHGIRSGWFFWPANFDPTWLESCNGFTDRNTEKGEQK